MSRTGAKKRTLNNSTSGSGTGKKKSITPTKLAERSNSTKSIPQKQVQALKRKIINRKGRDEDVRQNIDAKWRDGNQMMSQSRSENNVRTIIIHD